MRIERAQRAALVAGRVAAHRQRPRSTMELVPPHYSGRVHS
ncbi:hypothetical protein [Amycolatopsis sp. DG1A-15b]|nr:hypothetical protein [Amycolatopsis sp. DG1A-15b]WIX88724.1 hypothetical protein QRY02_47760 [Amycolatopsis sp. DG1A-15b]